jgi:hypothetical protein
MQHASAITVLRDSAAFQLFDRVVTSLAAAVCSNPRVGVVQEF